MNGFYITLRSDSNKDIYPNNSPGRFFTKLPERINLSKYVNGLSEIQYPSKRTHITSDCFMTFRHKGKTEKIFLPVGSYRDIPHLIEVIHQSLKDARKERWVTLFWDKVEMKVILIMNKHESTLKLGRKLADILGFNDGGLFVAGGNVEDVCADIERGMTSMFVYSPIVSTRMVGDKLSPLLRIIPLKTRELNSNIHQEFQDVRYIPSTNQSIDEIEILIRRDDGNNIPFDSGRVSITLHFKPIA